MHGIIFFLLQRYADHAFGADGWAHLFEEANLPFKTYSPAESHQEADLLQLVNAAAKIADRPVNEIVESFGEYIAPELLALHPKHVDKKWRTLELLVNTETVLHNVVRHTNPEADPPVLRAQYVDKNEVQLIYASPRKLCSLVKGIVRGVSQHFGETIHANEDACMHRGDPFCSFRFTRADREETITSYDSEFGDTIALKRSGSQGDQSSVSAWELHPVTEGSVPRDGQDAINSPVAFTHFGNYGVSQELGRGGMGVVYLATDPNLNREVAIKALLPEVASQAVMRERFVREARSVARLQHDRIIPIFHVGDEDNIPYMVMPRLIGLDLGAWLEEGNKPSIARAVNICLQIAEGLQAAHEQNIIHRDIKPSNVWLEAPRGDVKLMDFGLCYAGETNEQITAHGAIVGTPLYMAPELSDGVVTPQSDIYSVGIIFYRLLAGKPPFEASTPVGVLARALTTTPSPIRESNAEVPEELEHFVLAAMEKDPQQRIASAQEFYDRLQEIQSTLTGNVEQR
ncbi:MAG: protein kinase [Pirellulales bacterium]|nr:protein kinase [Pirellulales bacterium]